MTQHSSQALLSGDPEQRSLSTVTDQCHIPMEREHQQATVGFRLQSISVRLQGNSQPIDAEQ